MQTLNISNSSVNIITVCDSRRAVMGNLEFQFQTQLCIYIGLIPVKPKNTIRISVSK